MKLYLVRHAEAIERSGTTPDASRYLTTKGRLAFRKIIRKGTAKFLWMEDGKGTATRLPGASRK